MGRPPHGEFQGQKGPPATPLQPRRAHGTRPAPDGTRRLTTAGTWLRGTGETCLPAVILRPFLLGSGSLPQLSSRLRCAKGRVTEQRGGMG